MSCSGVVVESCELVEASLKSLNVGFELATGPFLGLHDCGLVSKQVQEFEGVGEAEERVRGREHLLGFELDGEGAVGGCGRMRWVQRVELVADVEGSLNASQSSGSRADMVRAKWKERKKASRSRTRDGRPSQACIHSRRSAVWWPMRVDMICPNNPLHHACQKDRGKRGWLTFARPTRSCMPWTSWSTCTSTRRFSSSSCRSRYSSELRSPCPAPPCPPPPAPRMFCSVDGNTVRFRTSVCGALRPGAAPAPAAAGLDAIAGCAAGHESRRGSASFRAGDADNKNSAMGRLDLRLARVVMTASSIDAPAIQLALHLCFEAASPARRGSGRPRQSSSAGRLRTRYFQSQAYDTTAGL